MCVLVTPYNYRDTAAATAYIWRARPIETTYCAVYVRVMLVTVAMFCAVYSSNTIYLVA